TAVGAVRAAAVVSVAGRAAAGQPARRAAQRRRRHRGRQRTEEPQRQCECGQQQRQRVGGGGGRGGARRGVAPRQRRLALPTLPEPLLAGQAAASLQV
ncbi:hypothetical protein O3G_MSEX001137, partial [Manduca sexta]